MADTKLSDLSAAAALSATDLFYVVQSAGSGGAKATGTQLLTLVGTTYLPLAGGTLTGLLTITQGTANASVIASTGYSLTGSDTTPMVNLAGTWNTSGTPTALKLNVTDTASNASSLLLDLQVGGASKMSVTKAGTVSVGGSALTTTLLQVGGSAGVGLGTQTGSDVNLKSAGQISWSSTTSIYGSPDVYMYRDAADTLAHRRTTNQQIVRVYNTYTDSSNYERLTLTGVAGTSVNILAETAGTGGDNLNIVLTPAGTGGVVLGANYQQFTEMTAPAAGASNTVRIYAEDNGSGKTRLMAIFPTGVAQQIAIEP